VLGGRTDANTPTDLIQKYYPYGFGNEYLLPWSQDFGFQTTCNQTDIWSPYFLRPDQDHFAGTGANFDPMIDQRRPGGGGGSDDMILPTLPEAVYGLAALKIESGVDTASPDFPNGPFRYIYTFGGIEASGQVSDNMYRWNVNQGGSTSAGDNEVFQLVSEMNTPRAYANAIFIPGRDIKIAVVGGIDNNRVPLNTVEVFTFDSEFNPGNGSWETFEGNLPEALEACGAGYHPGYAGEDWILAFSGWTGEDFSYNMYNARIGSTGNQVITEPVLTVPRFAAGSCQSGSEPLSQIRQENMLSAITFNRYYQFGGVDENGVEAIVETLSLP